MLYNVQVDYDVDVESCDLTEMTVVEEIGLKLDAYRQCYYRPES